MACVGRIREESSWPLTRDATGEAQDAAVSFMRPNYRSDPSDQTRILIEASPARPARVFVKGRVLSHVEPTELRVDREGPGGLDKGPVEAQERYALYAVPEGDAESAKRFVLVASRREPDTGPRGFPHWSYLGSFLTDAYGLILPFVSTRGTLFMDGETPTYLRSEDGAQSLNLPVPLKSLAVYGSLEVTQVLSVGVSSWVSSQAQAQGSSHELSYTPLQKEDLSPSIRGWLPLFTPQTVFLHAGVKREEASGMTQVNPTRFRVLGWQEDVTLWP